MNVQVTPLRQRMIDDMAIRNMSPLTQKAYVRAVKNLSAFFGRSPDQLTFEDVRAYQLHLVSPASGDHHVPQGSSTERRLAGRMSPSTFRSRASPTHCRQSFHKKRSSGC